MRCFCFSDVGEKFVDYCEIYKCADDSEVGDKVYVAVVGVVGDEVFTKADICYIACIACVVEAF
ncbi:hypothetical protein D3C76_1517690 [compost metagenome]